MNRLWVRKAAGPSGRPGFWVVTEAGDDSPLGGPDRLGNHALSFDTMLDASHAAQYRADHGYAPAEVSRGPKW